MQLYNRKTHVVGTLRMNRKGVPKDLTKLKLKPGGVCFRTCDPITIIVWHDKRDVNVITTLHDASMSVAPGDKVDRQTGLPKMKPAAVVAYNHHMGSVDKSDQMVLLNSTARKTLKWTKKLFFHLMDLSSTNAYILYCMHVTRITHLKFMKQLIEEIVRENFSMADVQRPVQAGRYAQGQNILRLEVRHSNHWPVPIPPTPKKACPTRACVVCKKHAGPSVTGRHWRKGMSRKRTESRFMCRGCDSKPALCIAPCFELYHTQMNY